MYTRIWQVHTYTHTIYLFYYFVPWCYKSASQKHVKSDDDNKSYFLLFIFFFVHLFTPNKEVWSLCTPVRVQLTLTANIYHKRKSYHDASILTDNDLCILRSKNDKYSNNKLTLILPPTQYKWNSTVESPKGPQTPYGVRYFYAIVAKNSIWSYQLYLHEVILYRHYNNKKKIQW